MVKFKKITDKRWFNGAVIACIGVAFYVLLTNLRSVLAAAETFIGYFNPVILGLVFAYILNPLAKFFYYRMFRKMKLGKIRWYLSVFLSFILALLAINLLLGILLPQLVQSVFLLSENIDDYAAALIRWLKGSPLKTLIDLKALESVSQNMLSSITDFVRKNGSSIVNVVAGYGKNILSSFIALILALYLLLDKKRVLAGFWKMMSLTIRRETCENLMDFLLRCDTILMNFLGQSLLDALIIGTVNAIFMTVCGMQYIGLVSAVVGVTNLIPNFGPVIGIAVGGFVLLLVEPQHAILFVVFSLVLQTVDAYILKPKLFASSLGVSGLLILITTIVLGNMFGIFGVLLSIPAAAVLSFLYKDYFLPRRENRGR